MGRGSGADGGVALSLCTHKAVVWGGAVAMQVPPLLPLGLKRLKLLAAWCMEPKTYIKGKTLMAASDAPTRVVWLKTGQCALLPDPRLYDDEALVSARERLERQVTLTPTLTLTLTLTLMMGLHVCLSHPNNSRF